MVGILAAGERALAAIREAEGYVREGLGSGEQAEGLKRDGGECRLARVLKAPIPRPGN